MCLTVLGMYLYAKGKMGLWNIVVGVSCMFRPTAVLNWVGSYAILVYEKKYREIMRTGAIGYSLYRTGLFLVQVLVDSLYFGNFTVTAYNFFEFNFWSGKSSYYGVHPWY